MVMPQAFVLDSSQGPDEFVEDFAFSTKALAEEWARGFQEPRPRVIRIDDVPDGMYVYDHTPRFIERFTREGEVFADGQGEFSDKPSGGLEHETSEELASDVVVMDDHGCILVTVSGPDWAEVRREFARRVDEAVLMADERFVGYQPVVPAARAG